MKRFNTPVMRGSFLAMIVGMITLVVSLIVWTQQSRYNKIYYTEDHFGWVWEDRPDAIAREPRWSITTPCVKPYFDRVLSEAEQRLAAHMAIEPPKASAVDSMTAWKKRSDWDMKRFNLDFDVKHAKERAAESHYASVREGEVRERMRGWASMPAISPLGYPVEKKDTRSEEEKFDSALLGELGIGSFPKAQQSEIFEKCVTTDTVSYVLLRTTHHTNLDYWPNRHPIPFYLGLFLSVGGFFGSFGYGFSKAVWNGTGGRLITWVRTGANAPVSDGKPDPVTQQQPVVEPVVSTDVAPAEAGGTQQNDQPDTGRAFRRFLPHLIILGLPVAILFLGFATNSSALGRVIGGVVGAATDPINLIAALIVGASIRRHGILIAALATLGFAMAVLVSRLNSGWGVRLTGDLIITKAAASMIIGYGAHLVRTLVSSGTKPADSQGGRDG